MSDENKLVLVNSLPASITTEVVNSSDFNKQYEALVSLIDYLNNLKKDVDGQIKELAKAQYMSTGEASLVTDGYRYTYVPGSTRENFDAKAFKEEHSDLYKEYVKVSAVSESFRVSKTEKK